VRADEKLTAFLELESAIRVCGDWLDGMIHVIAPDPILAATGGRVNRSAIQRG
jgi:hypothetical protein